MVLCALCIATREPWNAISPSTLKCLQVVRDGNAIAFDVRVSSQDFIFTHHMDFNPADNVAT
jgi:hypothetical protein